MAKKQDDKPAALDHVLYEIEMLAYSLWALNRPLASGPRDRNGWIEVFAVHARNLNEFFAPSAEGGGYMKPHHFAQHWEYSYASDSELIRRANSQISHLTHDRERPEEKTPWPFHKYFKALREQSSRY